MTIYFAGDTALSTTIPTSLGHVASLQLTTQYSEQTVISMVMDSAQPTAFKLSNEWQRLLKACTKNDLVLFYFATSTFSDRRILEVMVQTLQENDIKVILCTPILPREQPKDKRLATATHEMKSIAMTTGAYLINFFDFSRSYYQYGKAVHADQVMFANYLVLRMRPLLKHTSLFNKNYYGAAMYPEVWGLDMVKADIITMKKLHMNFTRIGEFMWSTLEPRENEYDFSLLWDALTLYQKADIDVVVGTPTPTPPRWLTYGHPERCIRNADGTVMSHGSRQQICTNNAFFRDRAYRITQKMAQVLTHFPNVCGIQLDNEFKCHVDLCFCKTCEKLWHQWLATEYNTIEQLNIAWGTQIWSETYATFDEVPQPTVTPFIHNSALLNAYRRFTAESVNDFASGLCHVIRQETDIPITHNSSIGFNILNQPLFQELDYVGFDTYAPADSFGSFQMNLDLYRNVKPEEQDFMLLETSTAHSGHIQDYVSPHPAGYLANEAFLGYGAGLKAFNFWHFRQHRFGVEQAHSAVVTAWGEPGIGFNEAIKTGEMFTNLISELDSTVPVKASVALIYSDEAKRFYNIETGGYYNYRKLITSMYQSLIHRGISIELIQDTADLKPYRVVLAPFLRHVSAALLARFKEYTGCGGKLFLGPMTGDRTGELTLPSKNGLDRLGQWLGFSMVRQFSMHDKNIVVRNTNKQEIKLTDLITVFNAPAGWQNILTAPNEQAVWAQGKVDKATVTYIGALPLDLLQDEWWTKFVDSQIVPEDKDRQFLELTPGLVKYRRDHTEHIDFFVANMSPTPATLKMKASRFMCNGKLLKKTQLEIPGFEHILLRLPIE